MPKTVRLKLPMLLLCLTGSFSSAFAQDYFDDDFGLWLGLKTSWKVNKTVYLQADAQTRFSNNVSALKRNSLKTAVEFRVHKHLRLFTGVLFSEKYNNESSVARYRPYIGLQLRYGAQRWKFRYRNLIQQQTRFNGSSPVVIRDRNQFTLIYSHSQRWHPSLSYEIYTDLSGKPNTPYVSRQRLVAELICHLSKTVELSPYFLFQRFYSYKGQPERNFIAGFTITLEK